MKFKSKELRGFLTGLIIGDGTIDTGVSKRAFRIKSIKQDFIDYIEKTLQENTNFMMVIKEHPAYVHNNIHHKKYWELTIKKHPYFAKLYHCFYNDYRKRIITNNIINWLTPQGIANWYMSDGYICLVGKTSNNIKARRVEISTDAYTYEDNIKLQNMFLQKFNINTSIIKRKDIYRIRICSNSYQNFFNLIEQYIQPSMIYKLYLGYEKQPIWMSDDFWKKQILYKAQLTQTNNVAGYDIV